MSQQDRHLTTEQLSAVIDNQLSAHEEPSCSTHLDTCEQCQQELAALRQTKNLLRALPALPVPRSFVLPLDTTIAPDPQEKEKEHEPINITYERQRRRMPPAVRVTLRTLSSLVAIIGMLFLLSGLLPALQAHNTASNGAIMTPGHPQAATSLQNDKNAQSQAGTQTQGKSSTNTANVQRTPNTAIHQQSTTYETLHPDTPIWPVFLFFDLNTPEGRLGLGLLLLILGCMGLALFRWQRQRLAEEEP